MSASPTKTLEYLNSVLVPWKETATDEAFSGMKATDFEAEVKESIDIRLEISNLEAEVETKKQLRDQIDERNKQKAQMVVLSVAGHQNFGKNSGLYKAMGFVTTSERKSGLTRKSKKTVKPSP
jgi:hypothetical protein